MRECQQREYGKICFLVKGQSQIILTMPEHLPDPTIMVRCRRLVIRFASACGFVATIRGMFPSRII
jgi:hypothetical protein